MNSNPPNVWGAVTTRRVLPSGRCNCSSNGSITDVYCSKTWALNAGKFACSGSRLDSRKASRTSPWLGCCSSQSSSRPHRRKKASLKKLRRLSGPKIAMADGSRSMTLAWASVWRSSSPNASSRPVTSRAIPKVPPISIGVSMISNDRRSPPTTNRCFSLCGSPVFCAMSANGLPRLDPGPGVNSTLSRTAVSASTSTASQYALLTQLMDRSGRRRHAGNGTVSKTFWVKTRCSSARSVWVFMATASAWNPLISWNQIR